MEKLKPCPFCGNDIVDVYYYDPYDGYQGDCRSYIVRCKICGVKIQGRTKQKTIEAWNRRKEDEGK